MTRDPRLNAAASYQRLKTVSAASLPDAGTTGTMRKWVFDLDR